MDITAHGIQSNGALEELIAATGGNWGSNYVNEEFRKYFESVTVKGILDEMRTLFPDDFVTFMSSFDNKKVFSLQLTTESTYHFLELYWNFWRSDYACLLMLILRIRK